MINHNSKIVTFYSYKGGVGRSMALANVATLLAKEYGKRVLVIDWDLEAPGLNKFFNISETKKGLIDLFYEYKNILMEKEISLDDGKFINIDKYIIELHRFVEGSISILPAGQQNEKYASRVNNFNWDEFYKNWHGFGFIEYLKEQLKKKADIILIDSRTGVTDIGGICTLQMPDIEVLLFSLNEQCLSGTIMVAERIFQKSINVTENKTPPKLIIIPSRVETYLEKKKLRKWQVYAAERLSKYLPIKEKKDAIIHIKKASIPYIGFYSFGEVLAVEDDPDGELAESFNHLAEMILMAAGFLEEETPTSISFQETLIKVINSILFKENFKTILLISILISLIINLYMISPVFIENFQISFTFVLFIIIVVIVLQILFKKLK